MNTLVDALGEIAAERPVAVAFSGGRDSSALLHALVAANRFRVRAIHVRHDLAPQAPGWAERARAFAEGLGVDCCVLGVDARATAPALGPEAAARGVRYAALGQTLAPGEVLAAAQHAGDQAETFLLQALRGAGPAGLAAMPVWSRLGHGWLWRPWRDQASAAVQRYVEAYGLAPIVDPSNHDPALARGYLRSRVWPVLAAGWPAAEATLARAADWAAEAAAAIDALAGADLASARARDGALSIAALGALTRPRRVQVLRAWLAASGRDAPDHRHIAQIDTLCHARASTGARVAFAATEVRAFNARLFAMARLGAPPAGSIDWDGHAPLALPGDAGALSGSARAERRLRVGFRRGGERLARPDGSGKRLADWLRERRVPPWVRARLPLVYAGDILIAVGDVWQHPDIARWFAGRQPRLVWRAPLVARPQPA